MKSSKNTKKKQNKGSGGGAMQFLVLHVEKIVAAVIVAAALWFAWQGLGSKAVDWVPTELEEVSVATENAIRGSARTVKDEELDFFDYKEFAEQIKSPIPTAPYSTGDHLWNPPLNPASQRSAPPPQSPVPMQE